MAGILEGVKIVSMEQWVAAPMASSYMADWGADVIKVEPLTGEFNRGLTGGGGGRKIKLGGVEVDPGFQFQNRNKRGLAVDLKKEEGKDILYRLIKISDVFLSNHQLAALKGLRMDYDTISQINPRLIYAVVTGYGSKGPDKDEDALDAMVNWARSGMQYMVTEPGFSPPVGPTSPGDRNASAHIVAGIMGALFHREKTGKGQEVEFNLFHCATWTMSGTIMYSNLLAGKPLSPRADRTKSENPLHITYRAKDGRWLAFAMTRADRYWPDFCRVIERPELENDPRFNGMAMRRANCAELIGILDEAFATRPIDEWDRLCRQHHLLYSRVKTPAEVIVDPQALANDFFVDVPHPAGKIKIIASPVKFPQNPASVRAPAPELGQHNEEILFDLGYSRGDIAQLKEQRIIL